jgi:hypothetical protein
MYDESIELVFHAAFIPNSFADEKLKLKLIIRISETRNWRREEKVFFCMFQRYFDIGSSDEKKFSSPHSLNEHQKFL